MDTSGLTTLANIVKSAQLRGHLNEDCYKELFQIAMDGVVDFHLFHIPSAISVIKLDMNECNYINFPDDYLDFVAIGIPYQGRLATFTRDNRLIRTISIENGVETLVEDEGEGIAVDNSVINGYAAKGGKNQYYYNIDDKNRRIIIAGTPRSEVQLYYVSSGLHLDSTTYLPTKAKNALSAYILYKWSIFDKTMRDNDKERIERDYIKELTKLDSLNWPTIDELRDLFYSTFYQSPRR